MRRDRALVAVLVVLLAAACGSDEQVGADATLTVYSGREEGIVEPLFDRVEEETGIELRVRYGESAELAATLAEEGENTRADVFFAQDPGSLGSLEQEGLLARLPQRVLARVPARFRDPDGHWVGTSGRVRVVAYNTELVSEAELPETIFGFADRRWRGKIGFPPTNASFQAFVTATRLTVGEERTRAWLEAIKRNRPRLYAKNLPVIEAVGRGEVEVGFVNHYYLFLAKDKRPDLPVANAYLRRGDPGALVSVAGAAVLRTSDERDAAERFVAFLLSERGQRFYSEDSPEAEYPLTEGIPPRQGLPPLAELQGPDIELDELGGELKRTLELLRDVGFTT
jgi:iron(III) transport system substrate-binding protein